MAANNVCESQHAVKLISMAAASIQYQLAMSCISQLALAQLATGNGESNIVMKAARLSSSWRRGSVINLAVLFNVAAVIW
jgi:hypothetical protein